MQKKVLAEPAPSHTALYLLPQSNHQPVQPRHQHLWPCQVLHIHSFGCHIGPQSTAGTGPHQAGPSRGCHGPQHESCSLSACQDYSSHQLLALVLGKHRSRWRTGLCGETFSLFPFLCRAQVSRWFSLTFSSQSTHFSACIHPETHLPSRQLLCTPCSKGLTKTTPQHTYLVLSSQVWCPWMP